MDETDAAEAEAQGPVKTKAIQTWTCVRLLLQWGTHSGVSAESASRGIDRRQDCVCCFDYVERVEKVHSASNDCTYDLQLSRSICHCLHAFSFSYLFLTALRDFLDMTKRPLSVSPSNK